MTQQQATQNIGQQVTAGTATGTLVDLRKQSATWYTVIRLENGTEVLRRLKHTTLAR